MLIVDAGCCTTSSPEGAWSIIDVEVLGVIRRQFLFGARDRMAASLAIQELRDWPGEPCGIALGAV